jgi:Sulfotransferase family
MAWHPPPRGPWVDKLAALGRGLGDDGRSIVSLRSEDLIAGAQSATGLRDTGDPWFREPLDRLCAALDEEAALHLAGRLRARGELQLLMENRLRLVECWSRDPSIRDQPVPGPIIVTGLSRSGTTFLHELLACDPANRAPLLWELLHTVPPPASWDAPPAGNDPGTLDPRAVLADDEITLMDEMVPAFTAMHENRGFWPTECIFAFAHQFSSDQFTGLYNVPSYTIWRSGIDQAPAYEWHRAMLQTLQAAAPTPRWVLKAPSHLSSLPLVFATYPDARVVITHRDPLRVVGSLADMMATLHWMHSDHVDHEVLVQFLCMGLELQMDAVTAERDAGSLPEGQIADVRYADLVADPIGVVTALYQGWDLEMADTFRARLEAYVAARHTHRGTRHDYRFEDTGLDVVEHRALVAGYQARFGIDSEV